MLNLLSGVIRNDPTSYGGYVSGGVYKPAPVVDPATFGKATFATPEYLLPNVKRVDTPVNKTIRYYALGLALAQLDSTWDSTLDFSSYTNVTLEGLQRRRHLRAGHAGGRSSSTRLSHLVYRAAQVDRRAAGHRRDRAAGAEPDRRRCRVRPARCPRSTARSAGPAFPDWYTARAALDAAQAAPRQNTNPASTAAPAGRVHPRPGDLQRWWTTT